ncbi:hypothetical protein [Pseudomonas phage vB_PsaM_M1]|nr:hypothetical protein [Pseudomonas phage vB_PsaM_M1]
MESLTIVETNPYTFVTEVVKAIEEGFLVENSNRGWLSDGSLKEITLYKDADRTTTQRELGEFVIEEWQAQNFLSELCDYIVCGGKVDIESLYWDSVGKKRIEGKMYLKPDYTKEQLNDLDWADFKEAVKPVVGTGRDRNLLTTRYLFATGQQE